MSWSRRVVVLGLVTGLVAACGSAAHWTGSNLETVNGVLVDHPQRCAWPTAGDCQPQVGVAIAARRSSAPVTGASVGGPPGAYQNADGSTTLLTTGGIMRVAIVVLDLADGGREVVPLLCGPDTSTVAPDGTSPTACQPYPQARLVGPDDPGPFGDPPGTDGPGATAAP